MRAPQTTRTMRPITSLLVLGAVALTSTSCNSDSGLLPEAVAPTSHLGRGINLGNKLEAPATGAPP